MEFLTVLSILKLHGLKDELEFRAAEKIFSC